MDVVKEIFQWAKGLPAWQSDAVRRLLTQGHLTAQDQVGILKLAKIHHGLLPADAQSTPVPLREQDLPNQPEPGAAPTVLVSMQDMKNVNALPPGQTLTFGASGLTVVYGGNGSGKSGYVRILKRACRARDAGGPILPDVLGPAKASGPAEASIAIAGGKKLFWQDGGPSPIELAEVSVLDGDSARLFIDEAAVVSYVPYGLDIFPKLGQLLSALKDELDREAKALQVRDSALEGLAGAHSVGKVLEALSATTAPATVESLALLTPDEARRLSELEVKLAELKANDPSKQAEALRRLQRRLEACKLRVEADGQALGAALIERLKSASAADLAAEQAAAQASARQFHDEPLPGVGTASWKAMFRAAAEYSITAIPNHTFPYTGEGSRCVLCQQALEPEAQDRLKRFWDFIEDRTAKEAQQAKASLEALIRATRALAFYNPDPELVKEISEYKPTLGKLLQEHPAGAEALRGATLRAAGNRRWETESPLEVSALCDGLQELIGLIERTAIEKEALARPEETARLQAEYCELEARNRLSASKKIVLDEISRLAALAKIASCTASLKTIEITKKGRELTESALTTALENSLKDELLKLRVRFQLNFKQTAKEGQTRHQLQILSAKPPKGAALSDVLSEGEQHVIALAAFLAELGIAGGKNTVIFDDPVSSMDHNWSDTTAKRLVQEGAKRQVVIFTHNIHFVVALHQYAGSMQVPLHVQWLKRVKNIPGYCTSELPWEVLSAKKRLKALTDLSLEARKAYKEDPDGKDYRILHGQFFDQLRATWERTVEEVVLNEVVLRFRKGVETRRLRGVVLDDEDFKTVYDAMSLGSDETPAHDHATEALEALKTPDDLDAEITRLREFGKRLASKQAEAEKRRELLISPPKAAIADDAGKAPA